MKCFMLVVRAAWELGAKSEMISARYGNVELG